MIGHTQYMTNLYNLLCLKLTVKYLLLTLVFCVLRVFA